MSKAEIEVVTKMVLLSAVSPDPEQLARHTPEKIRQLADNISAHGLHQLIGITDAMRLIFGHARFLAMKLLGWTEVLVRVFPSSLSPTQLALIAAGENLHRTDWTGFQKWQFCEKRLAENPSWKAVDLAIALNLSAASVSHFLSPRKLIPAWHEALEAGRVTIEDCHNAAKAASDPQKQHELLAAKLSGASAAEIGRLVRRSKNGNGRDVRLAKVKIPLAAGTAVALSGEALDMESVVEVLAETLKEARKANDAGYDVKTWQAMMRDKAKGQTGINQ
jgi:ParB/RepB/Spo0J family partition protein